MADIPPGTYLRTSRNVSVEPAEEGRIWIVAECQKVDGSWQKNRFKYDLANCDGTLKWAPDGC